MSDHDAIQRFRRNTVCQRSCNQIPHTHANVDVELIEIDAIERFFQRAQGTNLHAPTGRHLPDSSQCGFFLADVGAEGPVRRRLPRVTCSIRLAVWFRLLLPLPVLPSAWRQPFSSLIVLLTAPDRVSMRSLRALMSSFDGTPRRFSDLATRSWNTLFQLVPSFAGFYLQLRQLFLLQRVCQCFRFPASFNQGIEHFGAFFLSAGECTCQPARFGWRIPGSPKSVVFVQVRFFQAFIYFLLDFIYA